MADSLLPLRPHVAVHSDLWKLIRKRSCWHFDAWYRLHERGDQWALYLLCEGRAGGVTLIRRDVFKVYPNGELRPIEEHACGMPNRTVTLNDKSLPAGVRELMDKVHAGFVLDFAHMKPPEGGYRGVSVALHYVRAPDVDVLAGIEGIAA